MISHAGGLRHHGYMLLFVLLGASFAAGQNPPFLQCELGQAPEPNTVAYTVVLLNKSDHLVHVKMQLPPGASERRVQLPVWNGLYQVRDFAQYVRAVKANDERCRPLPATKLDKTTWFIPGAAGGANIEYDIYADTPGPFGAQLNNQHAFFNLAELLMYLADGRNLQTKVTFAAVPAHWKIATALERSETKAAASPGSHPSPAFVAENYDQLVDSPVEIGSFHIASFDEGGGHYQVVVDADPADYNMDTIVSMLRKIVAAETEWMQDRPFDHYTFIYHLPKGPAAGGMEHAFSTAIDANAERIREVPLALASVSAHEFFHLWDVKRIRPRSLEPIDYTKENYTRALWFAEGVDSTVSELMLVRAGLMDEKKYLQGLAQQIRILQRRPAHMTQSAEESSLDTWFDKYPYYHRPERSISYYNKGEILGVLLDLQIRELTHGSKSLRDLFQYMNREYAKQGRYYTDSDAVRQAVQAIASLDPRDFFDRYVAGIAEIPYNEFFKAVGLELRERSVVTASAGFTATTNFNATPVINEVEAGSEAETAGLRPGDVIREIDGKAPTRDVEGQIATMSPGEAVRVRVSNRQGSREVRLKLVPHTETDYEVVDAHDVTPQQRARRTAWIHGESQTVASAAAH